MNINNLITKQNKVYGASMLIWNNVDSYEQHFYHYYIPVQIRYQVNLDIELFRKIIILKDSWRKISGDLTCSISGAEIINVSANQIPWQPS